MSLEPRRETYRVRQMLCGCGGAGKAMVRTVSYPGRTRPEDGPESERKYRWLNPALSPEVDQLICPACHTLCTEDPYLAKLARSRRHNASIPDREKQVVYMHPRRERVYIPPVSPLVTGRPMPEHLARAGYERFEVNSLQAMDYVDRVRARQTGNEVWNEFNYDPKTREERYHTIESDSPTSLSGEGEATPDIPETHVEDGMLTVDG